MRNNKKGFTLIELIVVIVIIGVLSAIAAPMMAGNLSKAKRTEAILAMSAIRSAERCYYTDRGSYRFVTWDGWGNSPLSVYIRESDLNGRYYNNMQYYVPAASPGWVNFSGQGTDGSAEPGGMMAMNIQNGLVIQY